MHLQRGSSYVALGSSFGAGPGLKPRATGAPRPSGRSGANYAHRLAARRGLELRDVTFSGATTEDLLHGGRRPAQIDAVDASTRLVTITAGGNDIGYLPAVTLASLPWPARTVPSIRRRISGFIEAGRTDDRFALLRQSLTDLVAEIAARSPQAEVVLVDYLTIFPPADARSDGLRVPYVSPGPETAEWGRAVALRLSSSFEAVARASGATFLDVGAQSLEHHAWSEQPWTRRFHLSLRGGAPYHPTAEGMAAVAGMLDERLG